jgi:hypothetical protein
MSLSYETVFLLHRRSAEISYNVSSWLFLGASLFAGKAGHDSSCEYASCHPLRPGAYP